MVDQTRRRRIDPDATPARTRAGAATGAATDGRVRARLVRVGDRDAGDGSRTSPRMRFDVLQIAAWTVGLVMLVAGLVALARTGFEDLSAFTPIVDVGSESVTPLAAVLWLLVGAFVLAAGTGVVAEQRLRLAGVVFAVVGLVLLIEPEALTEYLGVGPRTGTVPLAAGLLLAVASFVPPLSIRRPGVREG